MTKEREEAELKQLQKSLLDSKNKDGKLNESASSQDLNAEGKNLVKKLKITRIFKNENGGTHVIVYIPSRFFITLCKIWTLHVKICFLSSFCDKFMPWIY